jgi:glutamate synthase (NADPH) large chain
MNVELPAKGKYTAGLVFLASRRSTAKHCKSTVERLIKEAGQRLIGWRDVPQEADAADIGPTARRSEPFIEMLFVGAADGLDSEAFERKLYLDSQASEPSTCAATVRFRRR